MSYIEYKKQQEAEAQAFLMSMKAELSELDERDSAFDNGHECASGTGETDYATNSMDAFTLLAKCEVDNGFWAESVVDDDMLSDAGKFNVVKLKHWRGKSTCYENMGATGRMRIRTGDRGIFDQEGFDGHIKRQSNARAIHGIEFVKVKGDTVKHSQKKAKIERVSKKLTAMQRKLAGIEARKAREAAK